MKHVNLSHLAITEQSVEEVPHLAHSKRGKVAVHLLEVPCIPRHS
jgi:hypothetical protein